MGETLPQIMANVDVWQGLAVLLKAAMYGLTFFASGGVLFLLMFSSRLPDLERDTLSRAFAVAALLAIVVSLLRVGINNISLLDDAGALFDAETTRMQLAAVEGRALALRIAGLILVALCVVQRAGVTWLSLAGALLAATSFAQVGHMKDQAESAGIFPQVLLGLHLLAAAFWLGALWPLRRTTAMQVADAAWIMHRFGNSAIAAVGVLMLAGAIMLWRTLGPPGPAWLSPYGLLMLAKLTGVALLLSAAAWNKLRLTPQMLSGDIAGMTVIRRSIAIEIVLGIFILLLTAAFTTLVGPPTD